MSRYGDSRFHCLERDKLAGKVSDYKFAFVGLALLLAAINLPILLAWGTGAAPVATALTLSTLLIGNTAIGYAGRNRMGQELKSLGREIEVQKCNNEERSNINAFSKEYRDEVKNYNTVGVVSHTALYLAALNMPIFLAWGTGATQIITATVLSGVFLLFGLAGLLMSNSAVNRESDLIVLEAKRELEYENYRGNDQSRGGTRDIGIQTDRCDASVQTDKCDVSRDASAQTDDKRGERRDIDFRTRTRMMREQASQADIGVGP